MNELDYDLVIVGGGVAATHSLLALLDATPDRALRIAVIERSDDVWRGVPYGGRSSINSLIITDLDEFAPPNERADFVDWIASNWSSLSDTMRREGGAIGSAWLARHADEIRKEAWGSLYIPRRLYGDFLSRKTRVRLERSHSVIDVVKGSVLDLARSEGGFDLSVEQDNATRRMRSKRVLLAMGSPPMRRMAPEGAPNSLLIEDLYQPSLDSNLAALTACLERQPQGRRRLFILGSNATSLELIYMLNWSPALRRMIDRVVVLSGGGRLPERIAAGRIDSATPALDALDNRPDPKASDIFEASRRDIASLVADIGPDGCDFSPVSERLVHILAQASEDEARRFHHVYGMQFTRLIRRAGSDYRDAAQSLIDDGKMELVAGSLESLAFGPDGCTPRATGADGAALDLGAPFPALVNCAGFEPLPAITDPLLSNMLASGLVRMNATERGLQVDERFCAAEGVFVAGPLLAGVFNTTARFWHVENVRRIADLAPHIGRAISANFEGSR